MKVAVSRAVGSCVLWVCNRCIVQRLSHYNGQVSVEYQISLSQVLNESRPTVSHYSPQVSSQSIVSHYSADKSPTDHRHLVDITTNTLVDCCSKQLICQPTDDRDVGQYMKIAHNLV